MIYESGLSTNGNNWKLLADGDRKELNKDYSVGLYMRLSKDDGESSESSSITNQRKLLLSYAKNHGLSVFDEYVDDGFSGTNFNRPAFRRMLKDIEARQINMILVKDLSRLGRDYIMTGQYTEVYFPSRRVRFIAVNDNFDSDSPDSDIAPFKNVVNEMYARDTSRKIRSAFLVRMQEGSYVGSLAPYGYRKDPEDKHRLLPDDQASGVVKDIFAMAAGGMHPASIAADLNRRGILSPKAYRGSENINPKKASAGSPPVSSWSARTITKLLRNPVYLGHMAQGRSRKVSFKSQLTVKNPPEAWILVENTHQALVSSDIFLQAGAFLDSRRSTAATRQDGGPFLCK
ncbi:recombinase family protein [Lacrimispora sp. NSJ-141]|uniref:Recombinase family protein n=1 Tax=Lientehia hominis TaxID=2897778 RepID=A0AAP2RJH5_9FIRM|nr:recombinase family protein [Lientehia hominis]MCD2492030.1 recombinase family protein [Lientehia hominis]